MGLSPRRGRWRSQSSRQLHRQAGGIRRHALAMPQALPVKARAGYLGSHHAGLLGPEKRLLSGCSRDATQVRSRVATSRPLPVSLESCSEGMSVGAYLPEGCCAGGDGAAVYCRLSCAGGKTRGMESFPPALLPGMDVAAPSLWTGMPMPFIIPFIIPGGGILPGGMDPAGAVPP